MKNYFFYVTFSLIIIGCSKSYDGELIFVEPENTDNFQFSYYLFIPDQVAKSDSTWIIIEPNNSGFVDDDQQKHIEKAKRTATIKYYVGNYIAHELNMPLIVPTFPRTRKEWKLYTHSLDRDVMLQKNTPLERIDKQLIAMFEDAQLKLKSKDILVHDQFLLTGFSASGTFANRFTLLHPEKVKAVAAGGLNGLLMLPMDSLKNERLNYPIGLADLKALTDIKFKQNEFKKTPQFYYMGALDDNDAIPYRDAFDSVETVQIYRLLGKEMQPKRWDNCTRIYDDFNVNATIKTYDKTGHEHPDHVKKDIVDFFKNVIY